MTLIPNYRSLLIATVTALAAVLAACSKKEAIAGYTRDPDGYYYKLLAIGDGNENPKPGDVLLLEATFRTQKDSVIWDSHNEGNNSFYMPLDARAQTGSFNPYLLRMVEGDSVSFYVPVAVFFKEYFKTAPPAFCAGDSMVKANVKLVEINTGSEYQEIMDAARQMQEDKELLELQQIDAYLKRNGKPTVPDANGIYYLERHQQPQGTLIELGKTVKVRYTGSFLDGREVDVRHAPLEIVYGTPDQLIAGLNIVIRGMKKGESAKIIVPSRLAFGENGSANGSVAPYSPLLYEIEILEVK